MLFLMPTKRLPLLYNAIIRTGLAGTPEVPHLDEVGSNALLLPYFADMPQMKEAQLGELLVSHISIFLHNALVASDFPTNKKLKILFKSSEKELKKIQDNAWLMLMYSYGKNGNCPIPEELDNTCDAVDKVALSMTRPEWECIVPKLITQFVDWFIDNRDAVEEWYLNRFQVFA